MPTLNADQNLLFGFIALQNGLLSREDLIAATSVWLQDKSQPLDQVLLDRGLLTEDDHQLVLPMVRRHLAKHDDDAEKSLAAIDAVSSVREELRRLGDDDLEASLVQATQNREARGEVTRTIPWSPPSPDARYQVLRPHAKGGLGLVSIALDEELKREVAFKEIQEQYAHDENGRARFVREAEITGGLEHPGIVPVYGLGQYEDGRPYYAMRLVKGENLRDAIKQFHDAGEEQSQSSERSLALRQLLGQFIDVCNAIEYAHSRGILHRDIKPANVMLGKYGETLVVDWGLAKAIGRSEEHRSRGEETLQPLSGGDSSRTRLGSAIGTPSFMSPEQAAGRLNDLGPTSDVYSLGATLYCILTGQPPLHDSDAGTAIRKAEKGDFPPPREIKSSIPAALEAVCLKAMALEPGDRYRSAALLTADIERWLADEPVSTHRESFAERAARFARRHRSSAQAGAVAALLITVCSVVAAVLINVARKESQLLAKSEAAAREEAQQTAEELQQLLYVAEMNVAVHEWDEGNVDHVIALLRRHQPQRDQEDLRGFEWYHLWQLCRRALETPALEHGHEVVEIAFSPEGDKLAVGGSRWITIWDVESRQQDRVFESAERWISDLAFSPDGSKLAVTSYESIVKVWDIENECQLLFALQHDRGNIPSVEFSPDGRLLASGRGPGGVTLWDAKTGIKLDPLVPSSGGDSLSSRLAFSSDGRVLAVGVRSENTVTLWDVHSRRNLGTLAGGKVQALDVSSDGKLIAVRTIGNECVVWDWEEGQEKMRTSFDAVSSGDGTVAFSPHSSVFAVNGSANAIELWDGFTGEKLDTIAGHSDVVGSVAFSPTGEQLASGSHSGTVKLWDLTMATKPSTIPAHPYIIDSLEFSPDGNLLVSAGGRGEVKLWDTRTWRLHKIVDDHAYRYGTTFSPDGNLLAFWALNPPMQTARIWDLEKQQVQNSLSSSLHNGHSHSMAFSPDSRHLAIGGEKDILIWDVTGNEEPTLLRGHEHIVECLVFSRDGNTLASGSFDTTIKLWNVATSALRHDLVGHAQQIEDLVFSPDEKSLISGSRDGTMRLWDVMTGKEASVLSKNFGSIERLALSCDKTTLAIAADRSVVLWDLNEQKERARFRCQDTAVSVAFSPDGRTLVAGLRDGTIQIRQAADPEEVRQAGW